MDDDQHAPPPMPRLGPCGVCGSHPDQRHRIRDTQWERLIAGEDPTELAAEWDWTPEQMLALWHDIDTNLVEQAQP
jgi:hypothetical protein